MRAICFYARSARLSRLSRDTCDEVTHPTAANRRRRACMGCFGLRSLWHSRCNCSGMSIRSATSNQTWTGVLVDSARRLSDEARLREVLGNEPVVVVLRDSEPPLQSIRAILRARSASILALMSEHGSGTLDAFLKLAGTLASLRRIVVLHGDTTLGVGVFRKGGVLLVRDCPQTREALRVLVQNESEGGDGVEVVDVPCTPASHELIFESAAADAPIAERDGPEALGSMAIAVQACTSENRVGPLNEPAERFRPEGPPCQVQSVSA